MPHKLTKHDRDLIKTLHKDGMHAVVIAEKFEVAPTTIYRLIRGATWRKANQL